MASIAASTSMPWAACCTSRTLGRRPFGSGGEALGKIVRGLYRKPRDLEADYPEELERIVVRALAVDREQRYQTAEEMRFELEQWLLTRPRPTQHADVARLVRERISDERRKMIDVAVQREPRYPGSTAPIASSRHATRPRRPPRRAAS